MSDLHTMTLAGLREALAAGKIGAGEATAATLERIAAVEPKVRAFVTVAGERALAEARALDARGPDPARPLWGVPVAVKDVIAVKGMPTTCGSRILEHFEPCYDAFVVRRLREAGAVIVGKTNMDEFAMGSSTEKSAFGPTANPWDTTRVPGGSSGGSAAAVAAGQCFGALGTDTGGSIRQPASFCGCVGLKPTYGRVSRWGCVAYGSSLDQIGPMARTVQDTALLFQAIAGFDPQDSTCVDAALPDTPAALAACEDLAGLRIGVPREYWGQGLAPEVEAACRAALDAAAARGATLVPVELPHTPYAVAAYYIIAMAEASSNLARFDGVRYGLRDKDARELLDMYVRSRSRGFGEEVQRRIMIGTYVLSAGYYDAYYRKAAQVRRLIRQDFAEALKRCDVLCGPVSPVTAWPLGAMDADPVQMYLMDIFTISLNLAGLPGLSLPVGLGADSGLPVGLQLLGPAFGEARLLAVAGVLERALGPLPAPAGL
ncbi:Asp-tRNA(Asn)/Glu-tRNA(Gln) amidotransferase subunit GatA [Desulfocurvus sp.]|uniref:Asp-tRNA(Asn)/Glu-tRNA(Gln) amidotransferase subunit GatA n=1 Tax=Desulfocurvus sp. TaxID=2871698 RepID=UPI0025B9F844|nr:Asp-tRNA(Asn)/Glu-tRNA(Gln) amidotransferase subunit GatA [Desulfocurvus sp.]MCK9239712.1 Asp-tRNA(Asn)/Glu-tRNA(Gln) amidotransferase subunit GatA [Desulfocurvus sp.]